MKISAINDTYNFLDRVGAIREIMYVNITLRPSNPNNADLWEDIDDGLNARQISIYRENQVNSKTGETIIIDEDTTRKFAMSEDGYGNSKVTGYDEQGKKITVTTEDANGHAKEDVSDKLQVINEQIAALQNKLNALIAKTNEN